MKTLGVFILLSWLSTSFAFAQQNEQQKDTIQKLDALFDDFRLFVKITEKLSSAQALLHQEAENFDWEKL